MPSIQELDADIRAARKGLRALGVPLKLLDGVKTRSQLSQRRTTGLYQSNRKSRWTLDPLDPQYGSEVDCKIIHLQLLAMMCEFTGAPTLDSMTETVLGKFIGHPPVPGAYRDALTLESLSYVAFSVEAQNPRHGHSDFHIGHDDPTANPKHVPANISWRSKRSNLIQGDMTLRESRTKLVELIGRYFDLGEVTVQPG